MYVYSRHDILNWNGIREVCCKRWYRYWKKNVCIHTKNTTDTTVIGVFECRNYTDHHVYTPTSTSRTAVVKQKCPAIVCQMKVKVCTLISSWQTVSRNRVTSTSSHHSISSVFSGPLIRNFFAFSSDTELRSCNFITYLFLYAANRQKRDDEFGDVFTQPKDVYTIRDASWTCSLLIADMH